MPISKKELLATGKAVENSHTHDGRAFDPNSFEEISCPWCGRLIKLICDDEGFITKLTIGRSL